MIRYSLSLLLAGFLLFFHEEAKAQSYTSFFTGDTTNSSASPFGGICLMGGATESDDAMRWFLQQANGGDVLVLRTSGSDGYNTYLYSDLGVTVNSVETIVCNDPTCADESYVQQKVAQAEAIWFAGGDQWTYVNYWRGTAIDSLINDGLSNHHLVIGGTSAGMAIQGGAYFSAQNGTVTTATALADPFATVMTVDTAAFIHNDFLENIITDTHYDNPDRKGRHIAFLARLMNSGWMPAGIACDEYTAVCIDINGIARVFGDYPDYDDNAYFIRPNCALTDMQPEQCTSGQPLVWNRNGQALLVYQVKGTTSGANSFDLNDWITGNGGSWWFWSVVNGQVIESSAGAPDCGIANLHESTVNMQVYPNPASDKVYLPLESESVFEGIYTLSGTKLPAERQDKYLDIRQLPAGIYEIRIRTNDLLQYQRLIKQ